MGPHRKASGLAREPLGLLSRSSAAQARLPVWKCTVALLSLLMKLFLSGLFQCLAQKGKRKKKIKVSVPFSEMVTKQLCRFGAGEAEVSSVLRKAG